MKKFYLFVVLLVYGLGHAQVNLSGNANYHAIVTATMGNATGDGCNGGGLGKVSLNGIGATSVLKDDNDFWEDKSGTFERDYTESNLATTIFVHTRRRTRSGGCRITQEKSVTVPVGRNQDITYKDWDDNNVTGVFAYYVYGTFRVQTYSVINLTNPNTLNNLVGTESLINIPAISGVKEEYFNWMYHIDGDQREIRIGRISIWVDVWRSLPAAYQGINSLNILCKDFLPYEAVGKKIWLRANEYGSTVELLYVKSAPHILSVDPIETSCFDTNDGKVKINFSRPLDPGEILSLDFDGVNGTDVPNITKDGVLDGKKLEDDNSYTVGNLSKGLTTLRLLGYFQQGTFKANTYVMDPEHQTSFTITSPTPVDFSIEKKDISCFEGNDGAIEVSATGGTENGIYQYSIDGEATWGTFLYGDKTTITGLGLGEHFVKVRKIKDVNDNVGCIAKTPDDKEKVLSKVIDQPKTPLALSSAIIFNNPTFNGAQDGSVIASVKGGSPINDNKYSYEWRNENDELIDEINSTANFFDGIYTIRLNNVPEGKYTLIVKDKFNCELTLKDAAILDDPEPIEIKLKVKQDIFCNSANLGEEGNKKPELASNGSLVALVTGGKVFDKGLPYIFHWKKLIATDDWEDLKVNDSIINDLPKGTYSINVEDANGIMHGTYTLTEQTPKAVELTIDEPDAMEVVFDSTDVSCFEGKNGRAKASIKNGKSKYTYTWYGPGHNGTVGDEIKDLVAGTYYLDVVDTIKGCFVKDSVEITQPLKRVMIDYSTIETPTFSGASDGKLVAKITGGTMFDPEKNQGRLYDYEWKNFNGEVQNVTATIENGVYVITLENVPADSYFLTIKDKNYDESTGQTVNCSVVESKMKLTEPDPLQVVFTVVRSISCNAKNEYGDKKDTTPKDGQRDESQDGILQAHVTGGTPLDASANNGLPYYFSWKKEKEDGTWEDLNIQDSIISNLSYGKYALNVKDRKNVILGTYENGNWIAKDSIQLMDQPPVLSVRIEKGNAFCYDGNDGWATAIAEGGSGDYDYKWSNGVDIDQNTILKKGDYWVIATDEKGCTAYAEVFIDGPDAPLSIKYTEVLNPSFYKATNGKIVVEVTGGTIATDNTYWFEWKNSKGVVQTTTTTSFSDGIYTITLNGLPEEIYSLTVRDANYNAATNKTSCIVANSVTELDDPNPLEVTFEVIRTISCNVNNEFGNETDANPLDNQRDESQDGILKAHVTGGIQLDASKNNGLPYFYTWKKKQADNSWAVWKNTGDTAEYLSEGTYALNIEDANGIKLGTYVNNVLVKEIDVEKYIPQPDPLKLTFTKFDVGCTTGDDGWAEAHVTGGTAPYTYQWTNGETTPKIENITTNNYFVIVTDAKGCVVQGSIFVGDPNGIFTTETVKDPICYKGNDGSITLNVTGGNLPYSYLWNTGAVTKDLNNLSAGNYEVTITCPDCCVYKKRFVLKDPDPVIVNVGPDRTLCIDQNLDLDASIIDPQAKYSWTSTNGFTSNEAKINVSKAGTYHVKVTTALGCIGEDEIVIKTSQTAISAEFLLSSQAYLDEEVILVNTSDPFGESTDWVVPNGAKVVEQKEKYITLKFDAVGVYSIGLKQTQGECYAVYTKNIMVEQRGTLPNTDTASQFIIDFIVTPNPNNGNFKAIVNLENSSAINLRLFSSSGQNTMIQKQESGKKKYEVDFNTSLQSGIYIVVLETGQQTLVKKIIIN